jgi:hypothetical protein
MAYSLCSVKGRFKWLRVRFEVETKGGGIPGSVHIFESGWSQSACVLPTSRHDLPPIIIFTHRPATHHDISPHHRALAVGPL